MVTMYYVETIGTILLAIKNSMHHSENKNSDKNEKYGSQAKIFFIFQRFNSSRYVHTIKKIGIIKM